MNWWIFPLMPVNSRTFATFFFLTFKLVSNHSCLPSPPRKSDALRTDTQRNKGHQLHPLVLINPFIPSSLKSDFLKSSHTWKSLIFPEAIFNFSSFKKSLANKIVKTCNQDYSAVVLFHHWHWNHLKSEGESMDQQSVTTVEKAVVVENHRSY